jgi:hypothetical protein
MTLPASAHRRQIDAEEIDGGPDKPRQDHPNGAWRQLFISE